MINLSTYPAVRTALFVRIDVDEYRTAPDEPFGPVVLAMTDHNQNYNIDSQLYVPLGNLLNITATNNELRASSAQVTVSISGIPNNSIAEIVNSKIKSAPVRIYRGYFNPQTNQIIGDILGLFRGFVNNYSLQEDYDVDARTASNTVVLQCASTIDILSRKYSGRKTNPESQKKYFPTDLSMDRVPALERTTFDFGNPD
jgi:hypothetical protein